MQGEPFDNLNDYTEIDIIKKEMKQPYDYGVHFGGKKKYGLVTHTVFNAIRFELEERQYMELIELEHYDWYHTEETGHKNCELIVYRYKKVNGKTKLINI